MSMTAVADTQEHHPRDPRLWSDERKLAHSQDMVAKLETSHPGLAEAWRNSVRILQARLGRHG